MVLRMEQYTTPQTAVAKHRILSTYTYRGQYMWTVDNLRLWNGGQFVLYYSQFIHTNNQKEGNNLMHLPIEILVKWLYSFQMMMDLWLIDCGLISIKNKWKEKAFSVENPTETERGCRNKVNHHQQMTLWHRAMACILVDVAWVRP